MRHRQARSPAAGLSCCLLLALWPYVAWGQLLNAENLPTVMAPPPDLAGPPPPDDPRFFGTYCKPSHTVCRKVGAFGLEVEKCETATDLFLTIDYKQSDTGGMIHGRGSFRAVDHTFGVALAGAVVETGLVRGYLTVPGQHSGFADLHLSSDALSLRGSLQNEQLTLRKDACGNRPPSVTLISPQEGQSFPSGTTITLIGEVSDEDISIPLERMFFSSHRDGPVGGSFIKGDKSMTLNTNSLSAGQHSISFIAIDSGGLTDSRTATITVTQQPPQPPEVAVP